MRIQVGTDIVCIPRVRRLLADHPAGAAEIFTAHELLYCRDKRDRYEHLAARFAAKEALLKALGTGLGPGMRWTDIEVRNDPLGRPRLQLYGAVAERAGAICVPPEISLSHTAEHAVAVVLVQLPAAPDPAWTLAHEGEPCASI